MEAGPRLDEKAKFLQREQEDGGEDSYHDRNDCEYRRHINRKRCRKHTAGTAGSTGSSHDFDGIGDLNDAN